MASNSFNQPLNDPGSPPMARQASDFLNDFRDWWIKVPLTSKFIFYFSMIIYVMSWLNSTFPWALTNIPYFTVFHFELWRLFFSPFVHVKLAELIFGFFLFLPMAQEKERELGTIPFLVDFFLKNFLVEFAYLFIMSLLGFATDFFWFKDSYGVLNYYFVYLAIRCAEKPEDPTMILCLPIQIKAKWYPLVLILLFNLLFFIKFDFLFAAIIGVLDYKYLSKKIFISKEKFIHIENSEFLEILKIFSIFISVKNVVQPLSPNSEILANQNRDFSGKGVAVGKNYEDVEKNRSVENLNDENSRNEDISNLNMKSEGTAKKPERNDQFKELNDDE